MKNLKFTLFAILIGINSYAVPITLTTDVNEGGASWEGVQSLDIAEDDFPGFSINDASLGALSDAFDDFFGIYINGIPYIPSDNVDQESVVVDGSPLGTSITAEMLTVSGIDTIQEFLFYTNPLNSGAVA